MTVKPSSCRVGRASVAVGCLCLLVSGCGDSGDPTASNTGGKDAQTNDAPSKAAGGGRNETASASKSTPRRGPIRLGGASHDHEFGHSPGAADEEAMQSVLDAMQPLQVLLGQWRGVTNKEFDGSKLVTDSRWVWDFQTDKDQPALVMKSNKNPYFKVARLTYLSEPARFRLTSVDADDAERVYEGVWKEEPKDAPGGSDNKPQRTFKLELTQVAPEQGDERFVFNQRENNRYQLEVYRRRGSAPLRRHDTVGAQREGTSFALSDEDYGDKECIVSQGLGTITLSHEGKSYYVCCTGCEAAFKEDPDFWIVKAAEREGGKTKR